MITTVLVTLYQARQRLQAGTKHPFRIDTPVTCTRSDVGFLIRFVVRLFGLNAQTSVTKSRRPYFMHGEGDAPAVAFGICLSVL